MPFSLVADPTANPRSNAMSTVHLITCVPCVYTKGECWNFYKCSHRLLSATND